MLISYTVCYHYFIMEKLTNNDFFDLRELFEKETGLKAFEIENMVTYVNWLEKRLLNTEQIMKSNIELTNKAVAWLSKTVVN